MLVQVGPAALPAAVHLLVGVVLVVVEEHQAPHARADRGVGGVGEGRVPAREPLLAILGVLLWEVDVASVAGELRRVDPAPFGLAVLVYLLSQILSAIRWWGLSRAVGFRASLGFCTRIYFIGMFFGTSG